MIMKSDENFVKIRFTVIISVFIKKNCNTECHCWILRRDHGDARERLSKWACTLMDTEEMHKRKKNKVICINQIEYFIALIHFYSNKDIRSWQT